MHLPKATLIAALMLSMTSITALASDAAVTASATSLSKPNADVISRADHALRDYVIACSAHDGQAIGQTVTSDAVFEYVLEEPGSYLTIDATSLHAHCAGGQLIGESSLRLSKLRIFPTGDSNSVFVSYTTSTAGDSEHLALIELRGDRIAKLRDFTTAFDESIQGLVRR